MPSTYERAVEFKIDGQPLAQEKYRIGNVRLHQPLYDHHEFEVEILGTTVADALAAQGGNADLNALHAKIGSPVEVTGGHGYLGGGRTEQLSFKGIITAVEAATDAETGYAVILRGHSPTIRLDDVPRNKIFKDMKVSDWFQKVVGERGIEVSADATTETFKELVQRGRNDWAFAKLLFGQAGMHVYYDGRKILARKKFEGSPIELSYAKQDVALLSFAVRADARPGKFTEKVWGEADAGKVLQASTSSGKTTAKATHEFTKNAEKASGSFFAVEGDVEPALAAGNMAVVDLDVGSHRGAWLASLSIASGRSDHMGLAPGKIVQISGMSGGLDGNYVVTAVTHVWSDERLVYENSFTCIPEGSIAPPREMRTSIDHEIWTARVTGLKDPDGLGRVKVKFLNFEDEKLARLSSFYLNDKGGFLCYPEIGDEVIVGFVDGDARYPVILGSVFHPKKPGAAYDEVKKHVEDETNDIKVFRTRAGSLLRFTETKDSQKIELLTPNKETTFTLDATKDKVLVSITSEKDVSITAKENCTITTQKDVTVEAKGKVTVKADQDISLDTKANLKMKAAQNVTIEGMQVEVKGGSGSVKASASGVDVKGPIIKLN